jgi:hypothetical protein
MMPGYIAPNVGNFMHKNSREIIKIDDDENPPADCHDINKIDRYLKDA